MVGYGEAARYAERMDHSPINKRLLPLGEWLAENAYISPGKHRLMTAFGLMAGLFTGREMMNILTAKDGKGDDTDAESLAPPLRRFHGVMAYNPHEDSPDAKWHRVADAFVPMLFGAIGAMTGSARFAKTTPLMAALEKQMAGGSERFGLQHADYLANKVQSEKLNYLAGLGLNMGSTSGVHLFPTMLASSTSAFRFQIDHGKNIIMPGLRRLSGNRAHSSRNLFNTLDDFTKWAQNNAAHYTSREWYHADTQPLFKYTKDMLQVFKEATPEQRRIVEQRLEELCRQLDGIAEAEAGKTGLQGEALVKELAREGGAFDRTIKGFVHGGLEQSFIKAGLIDPANMEKTMQNIALGDNGIVSKAVSLLGGRQHIAEVAKQYERSVTQRAAGDYTPQRVDRLIPKDGVPYLGGAAAVAATIGLTESLGRAKRHAPPDSPLRLPDQPDLPVDRSLPRHQQARQFHRLLEQKKGHGIKDMINDKPLDGLNWLASVLVVPPGLHRFMNAGFLSAFLYGGAKLSSALAARELKGAPLSKEAVWPVLRPLYGRMAYRFKSADPTDRWKHVAHQLMPVSIGAFGTYTGSRLYFSDAIDRAEKAEYLEDYTDRISLEESESYARASAVTSILNTGSGLHMLPFVSYPSNLQNRFLMAKGQQVASPLLGKWWSGNPAHYPWHVRRHLDQMVRYAVGNPAEYPQAFEPMAEALLAKLYPDMPPGELAEKRDALVEKLYETRDRFWEQGGIPKARQTEARKAMEGVLRRDGFERTLHSIGLNPLEADLDHNGMSGRVAKWFGAGDHVERSIGEYRAKAAARLHMDKDTLPPDILPPDTQIHAPARERPIPLAGAAQSQQVH